VESVRRAGRDLEIVVVDDASEDKTPEVCRRMSGIRYIRNQRRLGIGGSRNAGILASSSAYLSLLDDDDVRLPNSIDDQVKSLDATPEAAMVYGMVLYGDQELSESIS
jgi:glycosyltransferase involved in cell wall biosynthesis